MKLDRYTFVEPTKEMLTYLAWTLREGDKDEVQAAGFTPLQALEKSAEVSRDTCRIALVDGIPAAAFGVVRDGAISVSGRPWLLTGNIVAQHKRAFLYFTRELVKPWFDEYDRLYQYVDRRYLMAVRWLLWLDFRPTDEYLIGGHTFVKMEWSK